MFFECFFISASSLTSKSEDARSLSACCCTVIFSLFKNGFFQLALISGLEFDRRTGFLERRVSARIFFFIWTPGRNNLWTRLSRFARVSFARTFFTLFQTFETIFRTLPRWAGTYRRARYRDRTR